MAHGFSTSVTVEENQSTRVYRKLVCGPSNGLVCFVSPQATLLEGEIQECLPNSVATTLEFRIVILKDLSL